MHRDCDTDRYLYGVSPAGEPVAVGWMDGLGVSGYMNGRCDFACCTLAQVVRDEYISLGMYPPSGCSRRPDTLIDSVALPSLTSYDRAHKTGRFRRQSACASLNHAEKLRLGVSEALRRRGRILHQRCRAQLQDYLRPHILLLLERP